jgi:agmatinase
VLQNPDTRIKPFQVLNVVDYGDAAVDPFSVEASLGSIRELVREVAETGAIPIVLGGDHSILWPNAAAIADVHGAGKVGVIHLDTHADCSSNNLGHLVTHGTPIRRLIEDEHIPARNFVQIGLHSFLVPEDELLAWMRKKGCVPTTWRRSIVSASTPSWRRPSPKPWTGRSTFTSLWTSSSSIRRSHPGRGRRSRAA